MKSLRRWRKDLVRRWGTLLDPLFPSRCSDEEWVMRLVPLFNWSERRPRVLYAGLYRDYGRRGRGIGYEEVNFFHSLLAAGYPVAKFCPDLVWEAVGHERMQRLLWLSCVLLRPDVLFHVVFKDEFDLGEIRRIPDSLGIPTVAWFSDDHWRFDEFSRTVAPAYSWVCTTCREAFPRYREIGVRNVILTQWAANHHIYRPAGGGPLWDVSFVGQPHGNRREVVRMLEDRGIRVAVWGQGWGNGRASFDRMIEIFGRSRINLNLSKASGEREVLQIKGRDFEVPVCGGFLLTQENPQLSDYFDVGNEIAVYRDVSDLAERIRFHLAHEEERERVARAGRARVLRDHTYERRFSNIFATILGAGER